jgi:hypothetical protein
MMGIGISKEPSLSSSRKNSLLGSSTAGLRSKVLLAAYRSVQPALPHGHRGDDDGCPLVQH